MPGERNWDAPPKGRRGLPDTTGNSQPSMAPTRRAASAPKGATNTGRMGTGQCGPLPKPRHTVNKDGV